MDWEFEVAKGDDLSKVIGDGFSPTFDQDWAVQRQAYDGTGDNSLMSHGYGNGYDTGGGYESGGGLYDPPDDGGGGGTGIDPDPTYPPPMSSFVPGYPIGPTFDYSGVIDEAAFTAWVTGLTEYVDQQVGSWHHHDSLDEYMNGEWFFDIDPELLDFSGHDQGYGSSYIEYGQYSPIRYVGIPGGGGLVPIFSEWTEHRDLGILPGDTVSSFEVIHHTSFMGFQRSGTYQVASLDDPFQFLGHMSDILDFADLREAWIKFGESMDGKPNSRAMDTPRLTMAGDLTTSVSLDGIYIGDVVVTDAGWSLYDANGNLVRHELPLTQHWNQLDGVIWKEQMAHQERTMGVPFADALVRFASLAAPGLLAMNFWTSLGFGFASDVINGQNSTNATAYARLLEAAYELRAYQLRNR